MHQQNMRDDPRSMISTVDRHDNGRRPDLHRGRSNTFSSCRPYEDALYYNEPTRKQPQDVIPQRRRHSMQRRHRDWDDSDSYSSDSSDDRHYRGRVAYNRPRGRALSRRSRVRDRSTSSDSSHSPSRRRRRSRSRPRQSGPTTRPKETYTLSKALKSAAVAATVEAVRCRAEPGSWQMGGKKSQRVAVAAASGAAVGSLRNGRLQKSGKLPMAEAAMTGAYSVDFLKRVLRQTEFTKEAEKERKEWEVDQDVYDERRRYARDRSRRR